MPTGHADVVHFWTCRISCSSRPYSSVMFAVTVLPPLFAAAFAPRPPMLDAPAAPIDPGPAAACAFALGGVPTLDATATLFFFGLFAAAPAGPLSFAVAELLGDLVLPVFFLTLLTADASGVLSSSSSLITPPLPPFAPRAAAASACDAAALDLALPSAAVADMYARRRPSQKGMAQCSVSEW